MIYSPSNIIKNAIKNNKLSHAYLYYGDMGTDVKKHILESIKLIIQLNDNQNIEGDRIEDLQYFDLKIIKPVNQDDSKNPIIKKEIVDKTIHSLFESSLVSHSMKILYIEDVDLGNKYSLNRLLKFIEEPVDNLIIFMSTNHFSKVIDTIKSRTQNIYVKRESIDKKIEDIKKIDKKLSPILANIFANSQQVKEIDLTKFKNTYNEIVAILQKGIKNKYLIKNDLYKIWTKTNSSFVLSILQLFFYQLIVDIDDNNPLFVDQNELIMSYKNKNIDAAKIILYIEKTKNNLSKYGIFDLHKINLLNKIEHEI